jgi:hypothetical protein
MGSRSYREVSNIAWTYIYGPFLSMLPTSARSRWFGDRDIRWRPATVISGLLQFLFWGPVLGVFGFGLLQLSTLDKVYAIYHVTPMGSLSGGELNLFSTVLTLWNPLAWLSIYLPFEGACRVVAAVLTDETPGTLLLSFPIWLFRFVATHTRKDSASLLRDLVSQDPETSDLQLKIEACQSKANWTVGRLLHFQGRFYRIEACSRRSGVRPFIYLLRYLPAGVLNSRVIRYDVSESNSARSH